MEANQRDTAKVLLEKKADPNTARREGSTVMVPITVAILQRNTEMLKLLLDHKANPDPALGVAVDQSPPNVIELLLAAGANVNLRLSGGGTVLHAATYRRDKQLMELVLSKGADPNIIDNSGRSPLKLLQTPVTSASPTAAPVDQLAELLRRHGAIEDLPLLDRIEVRRPKANYSSAVFLKGTNDLNRFTLFEALAVHYGFISTYPGSEQQVRQYNASLTFVGSLDFPDLEHVKLLRPAGNDLERRGTQHNLNNMLRGGGCADRALEWGDVIEIPEADHPINSTWQGLLAEHRAKLQECLKREVSLTVKGVTTNILLAPLEFPPNSKAGANRPTQFMLLPVLHNSGLLRASSDLTRVKVSRRNPASGQQYQMVFDCSKRPPPDLWLLDGDALEVPEKPES